MKVADYLIKSLESLGVKKVFAIYGAAVGDLFDAFTRMQQIEYVCVMHEQGGGFAAEGYAKATGEFGVALATSGPGGMNLVTPIGNCFYDSVPCLFITGQINSKFLRPSPDVRQVGFQETDIVGIVKPITKYAVMIKDPQEIQRELFKAIYIMKEGRPGPVLLDIPLDIQKAEIDINNLPNFRIQIDTIQAYESNAVFALLDKLKTVERPAFIIGGGAKRCGKLIQLIGDKLGIPMFPTWNATDIVTSDMNCYGGRIGTYGGEGRNFGIQNADFIVCIGSRLSGRITGGNVESFGRHAERWTVDIDKSLLIPENQQLRFHKNIYCDASLFLATLYSEIEKKPPRLFFKWLAQVIEWRDKYDPVLPEFYERTDIVHPYVFLRELSKQAPSNAIILSDSGGNVVSTNHAFKTKFGQICMTNNGNSPVGFSMCGAMGAKLAKPNRPVICIIGDGGMTMNSQELQTLVNYNIKIKVIIINNHIYGITKAYQKVNFEGRCEGCGPKGYNPPDFVKLAYAYGIHAITIEQPISIEEMKRKIQYVLDYEDGPIICDVNCHDFHEYYPKVSSWQSSIEDMEPLLPLEELKANLYYDVPPFSISRRESAEN